MGRERIKPGQWGAVRVVENTTTKQVEREGVTVDVEVSTFTAQCRYRDEYGTYSQPQATASTAPKATALLLNKLHEKPVVTATRINRDSMLLLLINERLKEIELRADLAESTKNHYRKTLENVISPELGATVIRDATTARLNAKIQEWIADGRLTRAYNARLQLSECFRLAVQMGILQVNPMREVKVVIRNAADPHAITKNELAALRSAAREYDETKRPGRKNLNPLSDIAAVLTMTGCRIGEALALRYEDVDWENNLLTICGTVEERNGQRKPHTKSDAGMRTIDVPEDLMTIFRRRFDNQPTHNPHGAVFVTNEGTWVLPCNVRSPWRKVRKTVGLEWVKPHSFRVTVGTSVGNLVSPDAAAQLLGHASDLVTRKHYIDKTHAKRPNVSGILKALNEEPGA